MIPTILVASLPAFLAVFAGIAEATTCNVTTPCPASAPCCSEFGFCGTDHLTFADQSRILSNHTLFDGNSSEYDWVVEGGNIQNSNGDLALTLTETNGGTRISTTRYVHYGTITAKLKTGRWGGVVTAFITMSDIKDEIDWEFPGAATTEAQSNYFWQGVIPTPSVGETHRDLTDTFSNYHDYTIDWQPETLTFSIDGSVVRTVRKSETFDSAGIAHYPVTPSRVQFSIWPAGIAGSAQGTVDWAGGMIDWNNADYKAAGQFYALVREVSIKCTNAQAVSATSNITSYIYSGSKNTSTTPTIVYSNRSTLLNGAGSLSPIVGGVGGTMLALALGLLLGANALLL
ncbi:hypothetical protein NLJ89_g2906 [Agrocybe chaxingu]|uniref:GH16 domain-containing protein n=1 Tax=Agrocybe chaxingu TaxID=84603 RepID=A0A9W8MYP7_9AGAR|nr:hypothetical protein NLJ89_g2906 [Agrocybe chaxingu]